MRRFANAHIRVHIIRHIAMKLNSKARLENVTFLVLKV